MLDRFNKPRLIGYCFLYPVYAYDCEQYLEINGIRIYIDVHEDPIEHCKKYLAGFISINEV